MPDEIWDEAARRYDEPAPAALIIQIALINVWNRLNTTHPVQHRKEDERCQHPEVSPADVGGYEVYDAVLDHGARTPEDFDAYLRECGLPGRG